MPTSAVRRAAVPVQLVEVSQSSKPGRLYAGPP
jgi:hypothetical protein